MPAYIFPGYPIFLESAAAELGHPELAGPARRIAPLTALANLCAQASHGNPAYAEGILAKAAEFRNQLAVALRAADLMLIDVGAGQRERSSIEPETDVELVLPIVLNKEPTARKISKGSRESS